MKWNRFVTASALIFLAGCAPLPQDSSSNTTLSMGADRPIAERTPANPAEASAKKHVELGLAYVGIGRYDVALDEAKTAQQFMPEYSPAYHLMGIVYLYLDDLKNARAALDRALELAPGDPEVQNTYGWFLCLGNDLEKAQEYFNLSARNPYFRFPTRPLANSGRCYMRFKDDARAMTQLRKAIQADPRNSEAMLDLAELSYREREYDDAREYLIKFNHLREPTAASTWLGVRTERHLGHRDVEASYAAQLRDRFPDAPETKLLRQEKYE